MLLLVPPTQENYETIRTAAARIASYAESIKQAHDLGHGPGPIDEIWGREYQEKAMQVYTKTIPWAYLINLARQFRVIGRDMTIAPTPQSIADEWFTVTEYLRNAAEVILSFAPPSTDAGEQPLESSTPSVMEFGLLAEIASAAGANELHHAGQAVSLAFSTVPPIADNPLSSTQVHLLQLLTSGHTMLEIAERLGYSTRSTQRQLTDIQTKVGARSRHEAITIVINNGWLTSAVDEPN